MRAALRLGGGLFYAIISIVLVVGGLSLALAESYTTPHPTATLDLSHILQTLVSTQLAGTSNTLLSPNAPTGTTQASTNCPPPSGWYLIRISPGDTLTSLASKYNTTSDQLMRANCLLANRLTRGYGLYVPPANISSPIPCGAPYGWLRSYLVQPGDTLFHIATLYGTSVVALQRANCNYSTNILVGDLLWVPNSPTITPGVTIIPDFGTQTDIPTLPFTTTPLPYTATIPPTSTFTASPSFTPYPPTATITAFPTITATP